MSKQENILKWFNGDISAEEIKSLYPNEDFSALEKAGFYSKQFYVPKLDADKALADFKKNQVKKDEAKVIPLNYKSFLRIAAILVVMFATSYMLFFNSTTSISTDIAQTEIFSLPDNSEVILNAQSKIAYNKKEWKTSRVLELDGEAFFKVTKGKTFTVNTEMGSIEVLGTQFNVKERNNYFEVKCYEGSVKVSHNDKATILKPGKTVRIVDNVLVEVEDFNSQEPSWLNKESSFNNVPLWRVIDELEIQYNINIAAENIDTSVLFSGSFTHNDKNIALQSVTIPLRLSYKINDNKVQFYNYGSK